MSDERKSGIETGDDKRDSGHSKPAHPVQESNRGGLIIERSDKGGEHKSIDKSVFNRPPGEPTSEAPPPRKEKEES